MENQVYEIVECPSCGAKHKMLKSPKRLKNFESYSDGKTISPELSSTLEVSKCSSCQEVYWIEDAKVSAGDAEGLEEVQSLLVEDYVKLLGNKESNLTTDEELILRTELLWAFNDRVREGLPLLKDDEEKDIWSTNMDVLLHLMDSSDPVERLQRAEIAREKGDFELAEKILMSIKDAPYFGIKRQILDAVKSNETKVIKLEMK